MKQVGKGMALGRIIGFLDRYKYVLLVILVGAALLLWPEAKQTTQVGRQASLDVPESIYSLERTEEKMSEILSGIEGAGQVRVQLSVKNSPRNVLAEDRDTTDRSDGWEETMETVVISAGSGSQSTVLLEQIYPEYLGALVVCTGGEQAEVRLKLVEAVSALTGLGSDKICICKGK